MRRALAVVLVVAAFVPAVPVAGAADASGPHIDAVYPNPVTDGDRGEFVVVSLPEGANRSRYALADGDTRVALGDGGGGRLALSPDPTAARNWTDAPVRAVDLSLANGGETLRLLRGNRTVDVLRYEDAPESELRTRAGWRPFGATDYRPFRPGPTTARAFVLPDAPAAPVAPLRNATDRVFLAAYTLSDPRVRDALVAAAERGADVRVLVEGGPVSGMSRRQARTLDALVRAGVQVRVVDGPSTRYEFHHAKYAVADDRAVVLTENWKPAGTGGRSSRGWGVVLRDAAADHLARVFRGDWRWRAARPWREWRRGRVFERASAANGSYPAEFSPRTVDVRRVSVLVAPDNAAGAVVARLDAANESVRVVQATLEPDSRFAHALVRAADRGVEVRVLLSGAWYSRERNRRVAERLNARAEREDLALTVRLAEPRGRYEKVHAKAAIVDGRTVLLGSLNWNRHAARQNREVVVALESREAARYYGGVFEADWGGGESRLPVGLLAVVAVGALLAVLVGRRFEFGS